MIRPRALLVALAFVGCTPDQGGEPGVLVRDSAGVEIVESTHPLWTGSEAWSVDPVPILDLASTGSGPPHEFVRVSDIRRLEDGRTLVVDAGLNEVRVYSTAGEFLGSMGSRGDGPGEFKRPVSAEPFRGDSIAVWDARLMRLTILDSELQLGRVNKLSDPELRTQRLHWLGDTTFVASLFTFGDIVVEPGLYRIAVQVARLSFDTPVYDTIATLAGLEGFLFGQGSSQGETTPPFAKQSHVVVGAGVVVGTADRMEFFVYGPEGELRRIVRVPTYDLAISSAEVDRELEAIIPENIPAQIRDLLEQMPIPDTKPAYSDVLLDSEGFLWASQYRPDGDNEEFRLWEVFDPDGRWLGLVQTPARFEVLSIGADHLAGVYLDDLDVAHPQFLRLVR